MYAVILLQNNTVIDILPEYVELESQWSCVQIPEGQAPERGWLYKDGMFVNQKYVDLNTAKATARASLNQDCTTTITSGFTSSALGISYTYASNTADQANLTQRAHTGGLLSVRNAAGQWLKLPHTPAQAQQALFDFVSICDACRNHLTQLLQTIESAQTIEEVCSIVWTKNSIPITKHQMQP